MSQEDFVSIEIESGVLGSLLVYFDEAEYILSDLSEKDFYLDQHKIVFKAIKEVAEEGKTVDSVLVAPLVNKYIQEYNLQIHTTDLLSELQESSAKMAKLEDHFKELKNLSGKRMLYDLGDYIKDDLNHHDFEDLTTRIISNLFKIEDEVSQSQKDLIIPSDIFEEERKVLLQMLEGMTWGTGYDQLDRHITFGFTPPLLSIIAARPSIGKSSFKANIAYNQALDGAKILHISPEQGFLTEILRLTAIKEQISLSKLINIKKWAQVSEDGTITPMFNDSTLSKVESSAKYFQNLGISFHSDKDVTLSKIRHLILQQKKQSGLDIVYIDLMDRIKEINNAIGDKHNVVAKSLSFLSKVAQESNVHICGIVQINRGAEKRGSNKRPTMSDLKDAGAYEEYADLIIGLYREGKYSTEVLNDTIEVLGLKQRMGPDFREVMEWDETTTSIFELKDNTVEDSFESFKIDPDESSDRGF